MEIGVAQVGIDEQHPAARLGQRNRQAGGDAGAALAPIGTGHAKRVRVARLAGAELHEQSIAKVAKTLGDAPLCGFLLRCGRPLRCDGQRDHAKQCAAGNPRDGRRRAARRTDASGGKGQEQADAQAPASENRRGFDALAWSGWGGSSARSLISAGFGRGLNDREI